MCAELSMQRDIEWHATYDRSFKHYYMVATFATPVHSGGLSWALVIIKSHGVVDVITTENAKLLRSMPHSNRRLVYVLRNTRGLCLIWVQVLSGQQSRTTV